jgi:hypothetical protein
MSWVVIWPSTGFAAGAAGAVAGGLVGDVGDGVVVWAITVVAPRNNVNAVRLAVERSM